MKEEGKHFFFEKKKQKTFVRLSRPEHRRGGRATNAAVVGVAMLVAVSAFLQGASDAKLYLGLMSCLAGGVFDLMDRKIFEKTQHARLKLASGMALSSILVLAILLKARVGPTLPHLGLVTTPVYLLAWFGIRPVWLKPEPDYNNSIVHS